MLRYSDIPEFAVICSAHSPIFVRDRTPIPDVTLHEYHRSHRALHHVYLAGLERCQTTESERGASASEGLSEVCVQVLVMELLTQVGCAMLASRDRHQGRSRLNGVAMNILLTQRAVRRRILEAACRLDHTRADRIGSLQRRVERWCDVLIGWMVDRYAIDNVAINAERSREFGGQDKAGDASGSLWTMILVGIRTAFGPSLCESKPLKPEEADLVAATLKLFPAHCYFAEAAAESEYKARILRNRSMN